MFVNDCLNINEKGHLTIGGCDTVELAKVRSFAELQTKSISDLM